MAELTSLPRSIVPALDLETRAELEIMVQATCDVPGISTYKVGCVPVLNYGLPSIVGIIRAYAKRPVSIIYDHQKAGTDIPELGIKFARSVKRAGADAAILFPLSGPVTEKAWIEACKGEGLTVLVGGHMTHAAFLETEGGFIAATAPEGMYRIAAQMGVTDFVVPGNKVEFVLKYRTFLEMILGVGAFRLWAPGFISQKGDITETGAVAGELWHAIVGSALYNAGSVEAMRAVAQQLTRQIAA